MHRLKCMLLHAYFVGYTCGKVATNVVVAGVPLFQVDLHYVNCVYSTQYPVFSNVYFSVSVARKKASDLRNWLSYSPDPLFLSPSHPAH